MKAKLSILCLIISWGFMLTSGMILCACPGWPAMGVLFAIAVLWLRRGKEPLAPVLALLACLGATGMELWEKFEMSGSRAQRMHRKVEEVRQKSVEHDATNSSSTSIFTNQVSQENEKK